MYTATQARNIANEQYNHNYYKAYKRYVAVIMRGITRNAKWGNTEFEYQIGNNRRMTYNVLRQIADELSTYGYITNVHSVVTEDQKHKYAAITVSWAN